MANSAIKVSLLPVANTIANTDRIAILSNASTTANVKTITVNNFIDSANSKILSIIPTANSTTTGTIKVGNYLAINATGFASVSNLSITAIETTGTANSTTYLAGDGSWKSVTGSSAWADVTGKPTTISGYGITDGVTTSSLTTTLADYLTSAAAALTFLALAGGTITGAGAASTPPLTLNGAWYSGGTATTTKPQLLIEPSGTTSTGWSTAGTGIGVNAATGFAGNLIDAQVNGASRFAVSSTELKLAAGAPFSYNFSIAGLPLIGLGLQYLGLNSNVGLRWSTSTTNPTSGTFLVALEPDAANTLAMRNSTNAQVLNVYGTYADAANYRRIQLRGSPYGDTRVALTAVGAGTDSVADLSLESASGKVRIVTNNSSVWEWSTAGHFLAITDNAYDIGASGATRPRRIYVGSDVRTPILYVGTGLSNLQCATAGTMLLQDNTGTDFGRLQFGGTTSSFPALKRSTTGLQTVLADDSGFTTIQGILKAHANAVSETPTATHTIAIQDASGTAYKVLALAA